MSSRKGVDQMTDGNASVNLESEEGSWKVSGRRSRNKAGNNKLQVQQNNVPRGSCAQPPPRGSRGNVRPQLPSGRGFPINPAFAAPLERGWNWNARPGASTRVEPYPVEDDKDIDNDDNDDSDVVDSDDELFSDEFDSDSSVQSFESRKKNKWLKDFFSDLDKLSIDEINEPARRHCPACQNGPGSIDWYNGLQPLMNHAKTKGSKRVKIHRELAELLDEELRRRGTSVVSAGEAFGKWQGLKETIIDRMIIWPPMVMIMNTRLEQVDNDKWIGMGNPELLDYFSSYDPVKARHSYGPQGHMGMSILIFESSPIGYCEAERLNAHFEEQGTDRKAWESQRVLFSAGGNRQLYGYMANKHDLEFFNQHTKGKKRLKYELKSYQEKVVSELKQVSEKSQLSGYCMDRLAKEEKHSQAMEESNAILAEMVRRKNEENYIVRHKSKVRHEESQQQKDYLEEFYENRLKLGYDKRVENEESFEMLHQEGSQKVKQSKERENEVENFIKSPDKNIELFVGERDSEEKKDAPKKRYYEEEVELEKIYEEKKAELKKRYYEEEVELEKFYKEKKAALKKKYNYEEEVELHNGIDAQLNQLQ